MMNYAIAMGFIALVLSFSAVAKVVKKGDTARTPGSGWVNVKNIESVESTNGSFAYGSRCRIRYGGTVTAVGTDGLGNGRLLVRYESNGDAAGTECPTGVLFFTDEREFSRFITIERAEEREKDLIRRLSK
jgi:hypothetical protein